MPQGAVAAAVTPLGLGDLPVTRGAEAELHGLIAVQLVGPDLSDGTRSHLQDRATGDAPIVLDELHHADFLAKETENGHRRALSTT